MGKGIVSFMGLGVCALLLLSGPAAAAVIPYTFESLGAGAIPGKDGWTGTTGGNALQGYLTTPGGNTSAGSGYCVTTYGGTATSYGLRTNDVGWGYDLTGATTFKMGAAIVIDYGASASYGCAEMLIRNSVSTKSIGFGYEILPWYYAPYIQDAAGVENNLPNMGGAKNQKWQFRMEVDLTANGGEGSATLWGDKGLTGTFTQLTTTPINLKLITAAANITAANQVRIEVKTRLGALDDLWVTPEPAAMSLLAVGGIGLVLRRRRRV